MLLIGSFTRWVRLPDSDIELLLAPLTSDVDQSAYAAAQIELASPAPAVAPRTKVDHTRYAQLRGRACIKDWRGVMLEAPDGSLQPAPCTPETIDELMRIDIAQRVVIERIYALNLVKTEQVAAAGNGSAPASAGSRTAA